MSKTLLVTGASGYIGPHVCKYAMQEGYQVRGTVLPAEKPAASALLAAVPGLHIVEADPLDKACWDVAMQGVDVVIHLAHPCDPGMHEDASSLQSTPTAKSAKEYINEVIEGTANVFRAAAHAGVNRIVTTGSTMPQYMGRDVDEVNSRVLTEDDFMDLGNGAFNQASCSVTGSNNPACVYLKCEQHRDHAIWGLARELGLDVTIVLFGLALGPPLIKLSENHASIRPMKDFMENRVHVIPDLNPPMVDVRDLALAQVRAINCCSCSKRRINVHHDQVGGFMEVCALIKRIYGSF